MLRKSFGRGPAERIELARLRSEEFAGEAQFAIAGRKPGLEPLGFGRKHMRDRAEPPRLMWRGPVQQYPHRQHEQSRHRPGDDPFAPLRRPRTRQHSRRMDPGEKAGPPGDRDQGQRRHEPLTGCLGLHRILVFIFDGNIDSFIVLFARRTLDDLGLGTIGCGLASDGANMRTFFHTSESTTFPARLKAN